MKDAFSKFHPIVNLLYFFAILGFTIFLRNPVCLAISIVSATLYAGYLCGEKTLRFSLRYLLPMAVLIILLNPLVNHQGLTILGYFSNGNPFTLEAIIYGIVAAGILVAVVQWFSCWNQVMTTDKLVYLFGRLFPAFSLVISMTFRFVPRYRKQFQAIAAAQKQLGRSMTRGSLISRIRTGIRILSIMLTWAMEHAVETANSMKCRGYGLPGRTTFSIYRWTIRDTVILILILALSGVVFLGAIQGRLYWTCFPTFMQTEWNGYIVGIYSIYGVLSLLPMMINGKEEWKWNSFA